MSNYLIEILTHEKASANPILDLESHVNRYKLVLSERLVYNMMQAAITRIVESMLYIPGTLTVQEWDINQAFCR